MFGEDVNRVDLFYHLGVRIVQLTYNGRNKLGDGCASPEDSGLTDFGRACIERMNHLGILLDLSHVGIKTSQDAISSSKKPIAITHTASRELADVARNKPDSLLKAVADTGGVVGVYLMPFLRKTGQPHEEDVINHVEHLLDVCGEDHVGIGSDLSLAPLELTPEVRALFADTVRKRREMGIGAPEEDENVFTYIPEFNTSRRLSQIGAALSHRGHSDVRIEKILGGNWQRLLGEVWHD
jgi:membrane dipeptidase